MGKAKFASTRDVFGKIFNGIFQNQKRSEEISNWAVDRWQLES